MTNQMDHQKDDRQKADIEKERLVLGIHGRRDKGLHLCECVVVTKVIKTKNVVKAVTKKQTKTVKPF